MYAAKLTAAVVFVLGAAAGMTYSLSGPGPSVQESPPAAAFQAPQPQPQQQPPAGGGYFLNVNGTDYPLTPAGDGSGALTVVAPASGPDGSLFPGPGGSPRTYRVFIREDESMVEVLDPANPAVRGFNCFRTGYRTRPVSFGTAGYTIHD